MKIWKKIARILIMLVIAVPTLAMIAVQIPAVQTALVGKVTRTLSQRIDGKASIGKVYFSFPNNLILRDIDLIYGEADTVVHAGKLLLNVKASSLLNDEAHIRRLSLEKGSFTLRHIDDSTTNLSALLAPLSRKDTTSTTSLPWSKYRLDRLSVKDFSFKTDSLSIEDVDLGVRKAVYDGALSLSVDHLSLKESRGFTLEDFSCDAAWDSTGAVIRNLHMLDTWSEIHAPLLSAGFKDFSDFKDPFNKCSAQVQLRESRIDSRTIEPFIDLGGRKFNATVDLNAEGPLNDLTLSQLRVKTPSDLTALTVKGRVQGLPDPDRIRLRNAEVKGYTRTDDLGNLLEGILPGKVKKSDISRYAKGERVTLDVNADGTLSRLDVSGRLGTSAMGGAMVDAVVHDITRNPRVTGTLETESLQAGKILDNPKLGSLTAKTVVGFSSGRGGIEFDVDQFSIDNFTFNGYDYHDISAAGTMSDGVLLADLVSDDPNLKMIIHCRADMGGKRKDNKILVDLDLDNADLSVLNFDKREGTTISLAANADLTQKPGGVILGTAMIRSLQARLADRTYDIGDIEIESTNSYDRYGTTLESSFAQAMYDGNIFLTDFIKQARHIVVEDNLAHLVGKGHARTADESHPDSYGSLRIRTRNLQPLFDFLDSDIFVAQESHVGFDLLGDEVESTVGSELVAAGNVFLHNLQGRIHTIGDRMLFDFDADRLQSGSLSADNVSLDAAADTAGIDIAASFQNYDETANSASFNARVALINDPTQPDRARADIRESSITLAGNTWTIEPSTILYRDKHITVNDFALRNVDQSLTAEGVIGESVTDTVRVRLDNFDIGLVNSFIRDDIGVQGRFTGHGEAFALLGKEQEKGILLDLKGRDVAAAGDYLGDLQLISKWDDPGKQMRFLVDNTLGGRHPLNAVASYKPSAKTATLDLKLDSLSLMALGPFLTGLASDVSGTVSGRILGSGKLDKFSLKSEEARLNGMKFKLDYTQVDYIVDGPLTVADNGVTFNDMTVRDLYGHTARLSGGVPYDHFKDIRLNTRIDLRNTMVLNTTSRDNDSFYGKAFSDGTVRLSGPLKKIRLGLNLTTRENSSVHIPLGKSGKQSAKLLTFINNEEKRLGLYDSLLIAKQQFKKEKDNSKTDLSVNLRLNATTDAEIQLEVNASTGDILKSRGAGQVNITVENGDFDIKGDYRVDSGNYHFGMLGFTARDFSLDPGGTIAFNGDVMQSDLDITATYRTKANIGPLLADSTAVSSRRNVECGIVVAGKLANPQISFKVDIPDLDPTVKNRVESALNTEDKRMKQALALLVSGGFVPDEQSGIVNSTTLLYSNASEMMASQLNNILRQLDIPIDLGFNYQPSENGHDIFDVAVSTQLFNNRVSINGNIGNRQYMSSSNSDIVGDIDVEIKLNRQGQLRLTLFSHSADIYSNSLDMGQRNGAGIVYQEDFNSLQELWRKIFHIKTDESQTISDSNAPRRIRTE